MVDDIGRVDSVTGPQLLKTTRDRGNNQGSSNDQSPPANPENKSQNENEEEQKSTHLLDIRI